MEYLAPLMFGDREGVPVVPSAAEEEVARLSPEEVGNESLAAEAIRRGMSTVDHGCRISAASMSSDVGLVERWRTIAAETELSEPI